VKCFSNLYDWAKAPIVSWGYIFPLCLACRQQRSR
jgi:hypothetical protein